MAEKPDAYKKRDDQNIQRKNAVVAELPYYVREFLSARSQNTTTNTQLQYAYALRKFFVWLHELVPELCELPLKEIDISYIENLKPIDINDYAEYLSTEAGSSNSRGGQYNKITVLSSFFKYLKKNNYIKNNPCDDAERVKLGRDKRIVRLSRAEANTLLNNIQSENYASASAHQKAYLDKYSVRDHAIASLLLGTGIRVSECVYLDVEYVDLEKGVLHIFRKGEKIQDIFLSDSLVEVLREYLEFRSKLAHDGKILPEAEHALFVSAKGSRMSVRSVERLVKKYAEIYGFNAPGATITPHKLRKTYGTELYDATGDIYLVAGVLGHENIATTVRNYVADNVDRQRDARNVVQFGKEFKKEN